MEFEEVLSARKSTRAFTDQDVSDALLQELLQEALTAPSSTNTQAYRVAVATGHLKEKISEALTAKYDRAMWVQKQKFPVKLVAGALGGVMPNGDFKPDMNYPPELKKRAIECGKGLYGTLGIERHDREGRNRQMRKNFEFFDAPVELFLFIHGERGVYSALDGGIFLQTLMLAAANRGLGTCAQASVAMWGGTVRRFFDIEHDYKLVCGLSLGYPAEDIVNTFQPEKRRVEDICFKAR
ncbi:MAG: nitrobenzoate reductase [Oleiphilus sp.]|nr:MAG: nitrobenzoate reductase [Oleiphilus sp.]